MKRLILTLWVLCAALSLWSLSQGATGLNLTSDLVWFTILELRLPRVLMAFVVGVAAGSAALLMQAAMRSNLAEPALFGIGGFAALGAILAVLVGLSFGSLWSWLSAAFFAVLGLVPSAWLIRQRQHKRGGAAPNTALVGISMGAFAIGLVGIAATAVQIPQLRSMSLWAFGSFAIVNLQAALTATLIMSALIICTGLMSKKLSTLLISDSWIRGLGRNPATLAALALGLVGLMTATAVFASGSVAFVGLLAAALARRFAAGGLWQQIQLATLTATLLLLLSDLVARSLFSPYELPLGMVVAVLGLPLMLIALAEKRSRV